MWSALANFVEQFASARGRQRDNVPGPTTFAAYMILLDHHNNQGGYQHKKAHNKFNQRQDYAQNQRRRQCADDQERANNPKRGFPANARAVVRRARQAAAGAILDRFLHHAITIAITGRSYRVKDSLPTAPETKKAKKSSELATAEGTG